MNTDLLQNIPKTRENPFKKESTFKTFLNVIRTSTLMRFGLLIIFFCCSTLFLTVKGILGFDDEGENIPFSTLLEPGYIGAIVCIVLLSIWVVNTLKKNASLPITEQYKYYELGKIIQLTKEQQKALRLDLVIMYYHGFWIKTLEYYPCEVRVNQADFKPTTFSVEGKAGYKASLNKDWGIVSKAQYEQLVGELLEGMHSKLFALDMDYVTYVDQYLHPSINADEKQKIIQQNENFINQLSGLIDKPASYVKACFDDKGDKPQLLIWGFDLWRAIHMSRNAFMADYISEEEAWENILKASDLVYYLFDSFEDFYDNYRLGNAFWSNNLETTMLRSKMWKIYIDKCDWQERNLPWTSTQTPQISEDMKTGFKSYIESKRKKYDDPIGFRFNKD